MAYSITTRLDARRDDTVAGKHTTALRSHSRLCVHTSRPECFVLCGLSKRWSRPQCEAGEESGVICKIAAIHECSVESLSGLCRKIVQVLGVAVMNHVRDA